MKIQIDKQSDAPIYKQLVDNIAADIHSGAIAPGEILPSMNELSDLLGISKETVKKAYAILRDREFIEPRQGKGFFVSEPKSRTTKRVLLLFDKLSTFKSITYNVMAARIGDKAQITIRLHNQSPELLKYYLDESLDRYDYYVISPHFQLDEATQSQVLRQLGRVPNRKLIMLDNWVKALPGNYGVVYQDFENDIYSCLDTYLPELRKYKKLNVLVMPSSLYHGLISNSLKLFCTKNNIKVEFHDNVTSDILRKNEVYLLLNGQLDSELAYIAREAAAKKLKIGADIGVISYNDSPINELVLGGLTTVSADFAKMGEIAADMILDGKLSKVRCDFRMIRRNTF